eukprot:scaffold222266_cov11-Prasinocladus_malaysianus.AAC.1
MRKWPCGGSLSPVLALSRPSSRECGCAMLTNQLLSDALAQSVGSARARIMGESIAVSFYRVRGG